MQAGQSGQLGAHSRASAGLTVAPPDSTLAAAVAEYLRRLEAFGFSGAVLLGRGDASPRASWIRLRFREGGRTQVRRLHWSADGTLYGIGGSVYPAPVSLRCIGSGPDTCTAVHFNLPTVPIRFGAAGEAAAELQVADLHLSARRSAAPENQMD